MQTERRCRTTVRWIALAAVVCAAERAGAATYVVPDDFSTIQAALNAAAPGDTIEARQQATPYYEKLTFPSSGDPVHGFITLQPYPGDHPVLDGTGVSGANMVLIDTHSYVKVIGFEIRNDTGVHDGSGVRVLGSGSHIEIRNNDIHDIRGSNAMGITIYATDAVAIDTLIIDGNQIHDCEPNPSEALTLNGNVTDFQVTNNLVRDVNNIGIDFIGGETDIQPDPTKVTRNGVCSGNQVYRANQQGGGYAGGIYIDGGQNIIIERNLVTGADLGIEVGAENAGIVATGNIVRDNLVYENQKAGIVFGGYKSSVGRVDDCQFLNNTCYHNDTLSAGFGELWIQFGASNTVRNNIFYSTAQNLLVLSEDGNVDDALDYNLFFTDAGPSNASFVWQNASYPSYAAYRTGSGQDADSLFGNPQFVNAGAADFHLTAGSPAVNAGDPAFVAGVGETDFNGAARVSSGRVDMGAEELTCGDMVVDPGEQCDDGNNINGDGCDNNCTFTACGNGIVTAGEQCDDGNTTAGDCCSPTCQFEASGSSCDDGHLCTNGDACDGAGTCVGTAAPLASCRGTATGKSMLLLKDPTSATHDLLSWKLTKGDATTVAEFSDPVNSNGYVLCLYDDSASPQPRLAAQAAAGSGWRSTGAGFSYHSATGIPDGLRTATLKGGGAGQTKIRVKGRSAALDLHPLSGLAPPLTVQLRREGGGCWGATFSSPTSSSATVFKAKND